MNKHLKSLTFRLFANYGFLIGLGSVLNIFGNYFEYNYSQSGEEADRDALNADWRAVGGDLRYALGNFATEYGSKSEVA